MSNAPSESVVVRRAQPYELPMCLEVRREVFIVGQSVPASIEVDGLDGECVHFLAHRGTQAVGTARLRRVGAAAKIERVAVLAHARKHGIGQLLMRALEQHAAEQGIFELVLNAQAQVIPFYERLGYVAEGELFYEADIPHRRMRKRLR